MTTECSEHPLFETWKSIRRLRAIHSNMLIWSDSNRPTSTWQGFSFSSQHIKDYIFCDRELGLDDLVRGIASHKQASVVMNNFTNSVRGTNDLHSSHWYVSDGSGRPYVRLATWLGSGDSSGRARMSPSARRMGEGPDVPAKGSWSPPMREVLMKNRPIDNKKKPSQRYHLPFLSYSEHTSASIVNEFIESINDWSSWEVLFWISMTNCFQICHEYFQPVSELLHCPYILVSRITQHI